MPSAMEEIGSQFVQRLFSGIIWFTIGMIIFAVLAFLMWWFLVYKKKFNIRAKITSERAGDRNSIIFDQAAIIIDNKDGTKFFRLWDLKLDLPAPKFNVLQSTSHGDYIELYRTSENRIYFLTPSIIDKMKIIKADGKIYPIASQVNRQIDPDMDFWAARRMKENKTLFDTDSIFMKLIPYIPAIMGGMITIFVLYILLDHLPAILAQLTKLAEQMNRQTGADITIGLAAMRLKWKK